MAPKLSEVYKDYFIDFDELNDIKSNNEADRPQQKQLKVLGTDSNEINSKEIKYLIEIFYFFFSLKK